MDGTGDEIPTQLKILIKFLSENQDFQFKISKNLAIIHFSIDYSGIMFPQNMLVSFWLACCTSTASEKFPVEDKGCEVVI